MCLCLLLLQAVAVEGGTYGRLEETVHALDALAEFAGKQKLKDFAAACLFPDATLTFTFSPSPCPSPPYSLAEEHGVKAGARAWLMDQEEGKKVSHAVSLAAQLKVDSAGRGGSSSNGKRMQ